ncbi:hypothetical protein BDN72DRAFT_203323 [Pluteus cervinus]|uniref:Uncharacterized protein n=1 Tax=Pluteus cervinus TaxID=181527 RepID=A0ACD3AI07_9AGAR|nr:hypothetical protein BDN72DRAFT_203323 [Pluteus cervinus]
MSMNQNNQPNPPFPEPQTQAQAQPPPAHPSASYGAPEAYPQQAQNSAPGTGMGQGTNTGPNMNQNTHTNTNTNTGGPGVEQPSTGHGLKDKSRGATQVIHAGDYARGTALGYIDKALHVTDTKNADVAKSGYEEYQRGMASFRSGGSQSTNNQPNTSGPTGTQAGGAPLQTGSAPSSRWQYQGAQQLEGQGQGQFAQGDYETHPDQYQYGPTAKSGGPRVFGENKDTTGGGAAYPGHHRDDAVTDVDPNPAGHPDAKMQQQQQDNQGGGGGMGLGQNQNRSAGGTPSGYSSGLNMGRSDSSDIPVAGQPATSMRRPYSDDREEEVKKG